MDYLELFPAILVLLISHSICFIFISITIGKFYKEFYEAIKRIT